MAVLTAKSYLAAIQQRAIKKWGERGWVEKLAQSYVLLAQAEGDDKATYEGRRSQIRRAFQVGGCNADTLLMLATCVGCRFQIVCEEVIDL
jgi:hypothetical protein